MDTATQKAVPKTYISNDLKLSFYNNSNLKYDIQKRVSKDIELNFLNALNNMKGDNTESKNVDSFSEITLLALAYFYSEIFKNSIKNQYYTIEYVKGFLDANNKTNYTAIHEIDVCYYELKQAPLFNHCWLIIQTAWFFNSQYFGHHQSIDYLNHYAKTGEKLNIKQYKYDKDYLEKKYNDIDISKQKNKPLINGYSMVNHWYYYILYLICKELSLNTENFKSTIKDNREFNPLPKTNRQLRALTPFKIMECDIKSAFPTFLDIYAGANLKDHVYNNLMKSKNINRSEAKILFNKICNSGKYKSIDFTKKFFLDCGYTENQCDIIVEFTHDNEFKFYHFMTLYESKAIDRFMFENDLKRGVRLHDAVIFIDTNVNPQILSIEPNCDFGLKELNKPRLKENVYFGNKRLKYSFINSIPKGLNLISKHEFQKPKPKGKANGFIIYPYDFQYITASFNLNHYFDFIKSDLSEFDFFETSVLNMFETLYYLNNKRLNNLEIEIILNHIRANSNFIFNVRSFQKSFSMLDYSKNYEIKKRDFDIFEHQPFKTTTEFLKAYNNAKRKINNKNNFVEVLYLFQERFINNDYSYIDENINFHGKKENNILAYACIQKFNVWCTGNIRKQRNHVKSNPFYYNPIKRVTVNSFSLNEQQRNATVNRQIKKYEKELIEYNRLINNRSKVHQLILILSNITGAENTIQIEPNENLQKNVKSELMETILKIQINCVDAGAMAFDTEYTIKRKKSIKPLNPKDNIFDTDLSNSIFNHISMSDANSKGQIFFNEYLEFHKHENVKEMQPTKNENDLNQFQTKESIIEEQIFIDVLYSDSTMYGLDNNQEYYFTNEQIKAIEENEEHLPVKSLLIQKQEEHFKILKYGY